jgi:molecular chaperone GrpE
MSDSTPDIKVVDRRWWARGEGNAAEAVEPPLKPTYVEELEKQIAEKDVLIQSYLSKYREASAGFDEARARLRKEVAKEIERGRRTLLVEFIDVLDNLDRAIAAATEASATDTALLQGVQMVRQQFLAKLEGFGVRRLDPLGEPFDPTRHEAVSSVPTDIPERDGLVVGVVAAGYVIGDEVLRPAMVAVAKAQ